MVDAAHLTSASFSDKPSIFEVLAQESLVSTIRPGIKHAVQVLCDHRPDRYGWLLRYYEEIYTSLDLLLQYYYLNKYRKLIYEDLQIGEVLLLLRIFTVWKESPVHKGMVWVRDYPDQHFGSLLFVYKNLDYTTMKAAADYKIDDDLMYNVLIPYIKQKLDEKFEELRHVYNSYIQNQEMLRLSSVFVSIYPYVHTTWEAAMLGYQTAYMFNKSDWHSPLLHLSGVRLSVITEDQAEIESHDLISNHTSVGGRLWYLWKKLFNITAVTLSTSLSVGMFFIQFLDWWYTNDSASTSLTSLPVPDPPMEVDSVTKPSQQQYGVCPLCHKTRSNDTALSTSGYVFCYPCVYDYVKENQKCPVTNYPARTEHLIKLYVSNS